MSNMKLVYQCKEFLCYWERLRAKNTMRQPYKKKGNMICVRDFVNILVMVIGYMYGMAALKVSKPMVSLDRKFGS